MVPETPGISESQIITMYVAFDEEGKFDIARSDIEMPDEFSCDKPAMVRAVDIASGTVIEEKVVADVLDSPPQVSEESVQEAIKDLQDAAKNDPGLRDVLKALGVSQD